MLLFGHKYRYLFILVLGLFSFVNTLFSEAFRYYGIEEPVFYIILCFVLVCLVVWESNRLLQYLLRAQFARKKYTVHPLLIFFGLSQVVAALGGMLVFYSITFLLLHETLPFNHISLRLVLIFAFRVNLFLHCINAMTYILSMYRQKELESEELKRISFQAELQAIKSQINPHFLFNNLNVLSSLVLQKNSDANTFIEAFSTVYRYILNNHEKELMPLQKELDFIDPYFYLLKTRFADGLNLSIDIPQEYRDYYVVPIALQMVIENSIKHNIVSVKKPLYIDLYVKDGYLIVSNNLQEKKDKEISTRWGLENINKRYFMMINREIKIEKSSLHFCVSLPLVDMSQKV